MAVVAALVLANLCLKLAWTGVNELGGDEPFTVYWSQRSWAELFRMLRTENNPPLYFLLMHGWQALVPLDAAWLRVPSAVFSALTVWPLFLLGKRFGGPAGGLTAALLFTFSQHNYAFAHEVRAYPLLVLACTWAVWQLVRLADDGQRLPSLRPATIGWLVAANVVATWAHYFGWLMVGLEVVLVFAVPLLRPVRAKMLGAALLTVACSIPLMGVLWDRAGSSLGQGTWLGAPSWEEPYNMVMRWSNAPVVAVLFLGLVGATVVRMRHNLQDLAIPLWWTFLPLLAMFGISFLFPVYLDRYLLFAAPGFYLLVALAARHSWPGKWAPILLPAGCVLAMAFTFKPWQDNGVHPSRVVGQVKAWRGPHTAVLIQPAWYGITYAWALDPLLYRGAAPLEITLREAGILPVEGARVPVLDSTITTVAHVDAWASLTDPEGNVLRTLRDRFVQEDSVEADRKVMLRLFRRR